MTSSEMEKMKMLQGLEQRKKQVFHDPTDYPIFQASHPPKSLLTIQLILRLLETIYRIESLKEMVNGKSIKK